MQSVQVYGDKTWPMKTEDMWRLEQTERLLYGVSVRITSRELIDGIGVAEVVKQGRLR